MLKLPAGRPLSRLSKTFEDGVHGGSGRYEAKRGPRPGHARRPTLGGNYAAAGADAGGGARRSVHAEGAGGAGGGAAAGRYRAGFENPPGPRYTRTLPEESAALEAATSAKLKGIDAVAHSAEAPTAELDALAREAHRLNETCRIYVNLMAANVRRRLQVLAGSGAQSYRPGTPALA